MSEWRGLCNPERHVDDGDDSLPECWDCETECLASRPCRCCLAAEVAERDRRIEAALALHARGDRCVARSVNEHSCSGWKCGGCYGHWPCRTVVALRGES